MALLAGVYADAKINCPLVILLIKDGLRLLVRFQ